MINVDISNVWSCVTLPQLLGSEKEIFDAHNHLCSHRSDQPEFLAWLQLPDSITGRLIHAIRRISDKICGNSDILIVCGSGSACQGAKAAIDLFRGSTGMRHGKPQIIFTGTSLSSRQWLELTDLLEGREYSLHIVSDDGLSTSVNLTARGLRWMMERKYGPQAKERISVSTLVGSPLHRMGQEEGYELFPMPKDPGGTCSALTAAALIPMAVAGIDPLDVLEGAAEAQKELDVRSFENPVWLYTAARHVFAAKGRRQELLCCFDHALTAWGSWWQYLARRQQCRGGFGVFPQTCLLPDDLCALDAMALSGQQDCFETLLYFDPIAKKVPVEMDWKDYDGLGFLSGKSLEFVEQQMLVAMVERHANEGVPLLELQAGELTTQKLGELLYFFELTAALNAVLNGIDPFEPVIPLSGEQAIANMKQL